MKNNKKDKLSLEKLKSLIISILVSIIAWFFVVNTVNPDVSENLYDIKIQINGTAALREKGLVIVNSSKLPACSVKIRGKRKDIIEASGKIYAIVNASDISRQGKTTASVIINSPSSIKLEKQKISTVELEVEPCYEKDIPIKIKQENVLKNKLIKSEPDNPTIKISGSKSDLEKISACKVSANLTDILADTNTLYPYVYLSEDGSEINKPDTIFCPSTNILLYHTVYDKHTAHPILSVSDEALEKFKISFDEAELAEKNISYGLDKGEKELESVAYTLNLSDIREGEYEVSPKAVQVPGAYIPDKQLTFTVKVEKLASKDVMPSITPQNLAEGYEIYSISASDKYKLTGTEDSLSSVKATVNLAGLHEGTHKVPLKFENTDISTAEPCFATVVITRKEE